MLSREQLETMLADLEADNIERTESVQDTDKFAQAICAFANDLPNRGQPGYLVLGARNDGALSGLQVNDQLLTRLGGIRSDGNLLPPPVMTISKFLLAGGEVAVVEVLPSDLPPVRYKGRVYIRVGPRKGVANEQEERVLSERRVARARSFDALPCPGATLDELALGLFDSYRRQAIDPETLAANRRVVEQQLASLRFFEPHRGLATHAAVLLFGKNPRFLLPGAYVQYLRLPTSSLIELPLDQAEISGDLVSVIRELEGRTKLLITTRVRTLDGFREKLVPDYPEWALRELLMNAVTHRDYQSNTPVRFYAFSDHIEIHSPGGLYGEVTRENFPHRSSYRNPVIAEAMKTLGFVNRFGYGILRAQALLAENGNPPALFELEEHTVSVKVYPSQSFSDQQQLGQVE